MVLGWSWPQFHAVALQCVRGGWGDTRCDETLQAYLALPMEDHRGVRRGLTHKLLTDIDDLLRLLREGATELEKEDLDSESVCMGLDEEERNKFLSSEDRSLDAFIKMVSEAVTNGTFDFNLRQGGIPA